MRNDSPIKPVVKGIAANFWVEEANGRLYIQPNWQAPQGRIVVADLAHPEVEQWRTLVAEDASALENFHVVGGKLLLNYMKDAHSELRIFDREGKRAGGIALPGLGAVTVIDGQWSSPVVCFSYSSFQMPTTFFSYSLETGKRTELSAPRVPSQLADIEVEQVWYPSQDGTRVPMFLAHKKNLAKNDDARVLLYGYCFCMTRSRDTPECFQPKLR